MKCPGLGCGDAGNGFRRGLSDRAAVGTELEAANALVERRAVAAGEAVHEFFEAVGAGDEFSKFEDFARGKFFPARTDRSGFANTA